MAPFYGWRSTATRLEPEIPSNSWYSFYQPWSHPVVLNMGPLDWESSTLTTRLLLLI